MADDYADVIAEALDGRVDLVVGESYGGIGRELPPSDLLVETEAELAFDARPVRNPDGVRVSGSGRCSGPVNPQADSLARVLDIPYGVLLNFNGLTRGVPCVVPPVR